MSRPHRSSATRTAWYKTPIAIVGALGALGTVLATLVGIITGMISIRSSLRSPINQNFEIVLDTSAAFGGRFESETKVEAAIHAVDQSLDLLSNSDNLAFRVFGGSCTGDNTRLVRNFGTSKKRVKESLNDVRRAGLAGEATLVAAVREATADFKYAAQFPSVAKTVVVITGSTDTCPQQVPDPERVIRKFFQDAHVIPQFRFIALGVPSDQQDQLSRIAAATCGTADFVNTAGELKTALTRVVEFEPVAADVKLIENVLNTGANDVNDALLQNNRENYTGAERSLDKARRELANSDASFERIQSKREDRRFQPAYRRVVALRTLQTKIVDLSSMIVSQSKSGDRQSAQHSARVKELNHLIGNYKDEVDATNRELASLVALSTETAPPC